jgi:hypothetical protein
VGLLASLEVYLQSREDGQDEPGGRRLGLAMQGERTGRRAPPPYVR